MSDDHIIEAMARAMEPVAWGSRLDAFQSALKLRGESLLKATAALAAYRKAAWRPIEEAPKDGTRLLGSFGAAGVAVFKRHDPGGRYESWVTDEGANCRAPTHFQPLPPPPEET